MSAPLPTPTAPATTTGPGAFDPTPAPRMDTPAPGAGKAPSSRLSAAQKQPTPAPRLDPVAAPVAWDEPPAPATAVDEARRSAQSFMADVERMEQAEREQWRAAHGPDTPAEARLRTLMGDLTGQGVHTEWVPLDRLRTELADLSREEFDAAFTGLMLDPDVISVPAADQRSLTPADRAARLHFGGDRHVDLVQLRTRATDPGAEDVR